MSLSNELNKENREALETKYRNYKIWLKERHFDDQTWVLNWDLRENQFAEFGIGEGLFYSAIFLTALAIEKNEEEYISLLKAVNQHRFARGMYPRYRDTFDTSQDPYYQLILALIYGSLSFSRNSLIKQTTENIIQGVRENNYHLINPDGSKATDGNMSVFRPIFSCIEGKFSLLYFLALGTFPLYALVRKLLQRGGYFNLFGIGAQYLIYHALKKRGIERFFLKISVELFAFIEKKNPYFLMVRDFIKDSQKHRSQVENILEVFPDSNLPNDEEPIAHQDVLWQRDPSAWKNLDQQVRYEYSGVDYLYLYQFFVKHYRLS